MKKSILGFLIGVMTFAASAVNVTSQSGLISALQGSDKNITITKSFKTSKDITIPAGYTVRLADGIVLTLDYKEDSKLLGFIPVPGYSYKLSGDGVIVTGDRKVVTKEVRTLPTVGGTNNRFAGMTYEVTTVESTGGSVSYTKADQLSCKCTTGVSVDGGESWNYVENAANAVVCTVSSGVNGGRTYVQAYGSVEEAYNAARFSSSLSKVTNGKVVVLLADGEVPIPDKTDTIGVVIDCAGFSGGFSPTGNEFRDFGFITFLNASSATAPKLTRAGAAFINCEKATVSSVNASQTYYESQTHIYDCGSSLSLPSTYPDAGGAFFYSGGPYSISFKNKKNYKVYGGKFTNDPSDNLATGDLEAVPGDEYFTVQEKKKTVNVAKIGSSSYETLQTAVDEAKEGDKIELISSIELDTPVVVAADKKITIELAGKNLVAQNGAIINNGTLKLEDSSNYTEANSVSSAAGDTIVNNGVLEITYGDKTSNEGSILLNVGEFIVHNATFNGSIKAGEGVSDPKAVANIRGGKFKMSVSSFLKDGYIEKLRQGYYTIGKFPNAYVNEITLSGADKAWSVVGLLEEDRKIYVKTSNDRKDYTDAEWYRKAELKSMMAPYTSYPFDCVVKFNSPVKAGTVQLIIPALPSPYNKIDLDRDLNANEEYRVLSTVSKAMGKAAFYTYAEFLTDGTFNPLKVGVKNLSEENGENDGKEITVELQLCKRNGQDDNKLDYLYTLASASYQFPVKTVDIALPTVENATWVYNGETVTGSITVNKGTDVELTLNAADGYQFADGKTSMTVKFDNISENITVDNSAYSSVAAPNFTVAKIGSTGYTSLAEAIIAANANDTIELAATEIAFDATVTINKPVTIKGASVAKARSVSASGTILKFDTASSAFVITSSGVTFKDLTIEQGTQDNSSHISISKGAWDAPKIQYKDILIENVNFVGGDNALFLIGENVVVKNSTFTDQDSHNIIIYSLKGESAITGNTFNASKSNNKSAILWEGGADNATDLSEFIGGGNLVISDNIANSKGVFFQFTNWKLIKNASIQITGNTIDAFTNKAIALYDMDGVLKANGDEFTSFEVKNNVFTNVPAGRPILKEYTGTVEVEASENYLGSAEPDYDSLIVGEKVVVNSYYKEAELETLVTIERGLAGAGSAEDPFVINDVEDLKLFRDSVNAGETKYNAAGVYVALGADIDMAGITWERGIGDGINATYDGIFDGNGKTIKNVTLAPTADSDKYFCGGLFGYTYGNVVIKNLTIENISVTANGEGHNVGALVGFAYNKNGELNVSDVTIKGNIAINAAGTYGVGAIVGYSYFNMGVIENCQVIGNDGSYITGYSFVGGITGYSYSNAQIKNCSVTNVAITATSKFVGGIAGIIGDNTTIIGCTAADATVRGTACVGSIVGAISGNGLSLTLDNCTVTDTTLPEIGGNYSDDAAVVAKVGNKYYTTLTAAISAATAEDTITLVSDVTLTETLKINSDKVVTLDLNGYVVDGREKVRIAIMSYGDLTIKDSSDAKSGAVKAGIGTAGNTVNICGGSFVLESGNIYSLNNAILVDEESASVEIKGGTITAEPNTGKSAAMYISSTSDTEVKITGGSLIGYNGILLWDNTSIEMTSGSIVAQGGVGIQGNGSKDNTEISISGEAVISGYYAAIYHPQGGKLSISGGQLSGWTGVVVKGGNVTITGGSISGTGAANAYAPVNSGYVDTGDALYVEHYDNSANSENYGTPVVTVTGGIFTSENGKAIGNYANPNNVANGVTKLTKYVSGGTFSDPVEVDCCVEGFAPVKVGDKYSVGALPDADVTNLGAITVGKGDYTANAYLTYDPINDGKLEEASVPYNLTLAMDFKAKDTAGEAAEGMFGDYITDFFIKMDGMSSTSFVGDGCYLAGYYASYGMWVKIPLDGFTVENGKTYPVITSAGQFFTYADICGTVGEFICGIYLTPEVLAANPNLTVELTLGLSENNAAALNAEFTKVDSYLYTSDELMPSDLPEVEITDIKDTLTENDPDLTFALNFKIKDLENLPAEYLDKLIERYGDYYTDYVLTISGLADPNGSVTFNADGTGDGYFAGQYDAWNANWVTVPFEDVTIKNGESLYIMECAGRITGQPGLRVTLREVAQIIKDFDCGVYFTPEFLLANPNLEVKLELKVFTEDEEGNKLDDISVATNMFDKDDFSVKAAKLYIRIVNGKPQIGYEGEGTLVLNAAANLTGEWTKKIPYTIVENDGDDTKTWVTPAEGYFFFKGFITK